MRRYNSQIDRNTEEDERLLVKYHTRYNMAFYCMSNQLLLLPFSKKKSWNVENHSRHVIVDLMLHMIIHCNAFRMIIDNETNIFSNKFYLWSETGTFKLSYLSYIGTQNIGSKIVQRFMRIKYVIFQTSTNCNCMHLA